MHRLFVIFLLLLLLLLLLSDSDTSRYSVDEMSETDVSEAPRRGKVLTLDTMNPNIKQVEYAVRGAIVQRAVKIEKELKEVSPSQVRLHFVEPAT